MHAFMIKFIAGSFESKAEKQSCLKYCLRNLISVQRSRSSVERDDRELSTLLHECGNSVDDTIKQNLHSLHFSMLMMHGETIYSYFCHITMFKDRHRLHLARVQACFGSQVSIRRCKKMSKHQGRFSRMIAE